MPDDRIQDESRPEDEERPRRRARLEDEEEARPRRRIRRDDDDSGGMNSLIPYKNPQALIAYYLGVFALIPCFGLLLGVGAIILGVLGLKYRTKHPTAGGTGHAWAGVILGTLVLVAHLVAVAWIIVIANMK